MPRSSANAVRIIGGRCRGRIVRFPPAAQLRPTPDRVRETLFNWLGQDLAGQKTLELYAGSGALSLEALSRGAAAATAVDRDPRLVAAVADNARALGLDGLEAVRADAQRYLERAGLSYDVIFCDPPYAEDPWSWLLPACLRSLAPGGAVYAEAARRLDPAAGLALVREGRAGQVVYHLFRPA
ncbi:MAG TPA: 16S rRNA (guanine(966)-N(2))-methyltransferase RsmD [Casimicrobiaceae bacterium]|nr:16S rRNA (guanine(966)-N(2))-methyltransferase RsmD [Casimicrobiaceae bacterium]